MQVSWILLLHKVDLSLKPSNSTPTWGWQGFSHRVCCRTDFRSRSPYFSLSPRKALHQSVLIDHSSLRRLNFLAASSQLHPLVHQPLVFGWSTARTISDSLRSTTSSCWLRSSIPYSSHNSWLYNLEMGTCGTQPLALLTKWSSILSPLWVHPFASFHLTIYRAYSRSSSDCLRYHPHRSFPPRWPPFWDPCRCQILSSHLCHFLWN